VLPKDNVRGNGKNGVKIADDNFIDYYELMQISPNAEQETIQRVYRMLAARYHPDNPESGDTDRFLLLSQAYKVLSDPASRADYEATYSVRNLEPLDVFNLKEFAVGLDGESNRRMGILCLLYKRRRADADDPGISLLEFETLMSFPREHLVFTLWYLKEKGFLRQGEESDFLITSAGVDYVEENLPANRTLYHLLKGAETGNVRGTTPEKAAV
jgi:curved DNA-binding protein CbpA